MVGMETKVGERMPFRVLFVSNCKCPYDQYMSCVAVAVDDEDNALEGSGLDRNGNACVSG